MKHNKNITRKKVISFFLTIAILLSTVTVAFGALAQETPKQRYTVTKASPAIPMNSLTTVSFDALNIETVDGTVAGEDFVFTNASGSDDIKIDSTSKTFTAYSKGVYKVTAENSNTGNTTTLFVVVKDSADSVWYLYNEQFGTNGEYENIEFNNVTKNYSEVISFPTGWTSQIKSGNGYENFPCVNPYVYTSLKDNGDGIYSDNGPYPIKRKLNSPGIVPFTNAHLVLNENTNYWAQPAYFTLNNEAVNAFSDYTISATMEAYVHQSWEDGDRVSGAGIFGRAVVDTNGALDSATNKLVGFTPNNSNQKVRINTLTPTGLTSSSVTDSDGNETWKYLSGKQTNNGPQLGVSPVSYTVKFSGTQAILTSTQDSENKTFTVDNVEQSSGAVGIMAGGTSEGKDNYLTSVNLRTFSVALNNKSGEQPEYTDISTSLYRVSDRSPAIPMNTATRVNLKEMIVSVQNNDILGSKLTFENVSGSDGISISNGYIYANKKGSYKIKVTNADKTLTDYIWAVVKNPDETEYVLYNADFSDGTLPDDSWKAYYRQNTVWTQFATGNYRNLLVESGRTGITSGYAPFYVKKTDNGDGTFAYTYNNDSEVAFSWGSPFYFYSTNEIFTQFSDYTVDTEFYGYSNFHGGYGIFGRGDVSTGALNNNSSAAGMLVVSGFGREEKGVHPYNITATKSTDTLITAENSAVNTWKYANDLSPNANTPTRTALHNFTMKLDGANVSIWSDADKEKLVFKTTTANTDTKGAFGFNVICCTGTRTVNGTDLYDAITQHLSVNYVKIMLNTTEDNAPKAELIPMTVYAPVNSQVDLLKVSVATEIGKFAMGEDVQWKPDRNEYFEIYNDTLVTFKAGNSVATAIINGKEYSVNICIGNYATVEYTKFAPNGVQITPDSECSTHYTVTGADNMAISENGKAYKIENGEFYTAYIDCITVENTSDILGYTFAGNAEQAYEKLLETPFDALTRKGIEAQAKLMLEEVAGNNRNAVKINVFENTNGVTELTYSGNNIETTVKLLYANAEYSGNVTVNSQSKNMPVIYSVNEYSLSGSVVNASGVLNVEFARNKNATYSVKFDFVNNTVSIADSKGRIYQKAQNTNNSLLFTVTVSNGVVSVQINDANALSAYVDGAYGPTAFVNLSSSDNIAVNDFKAVPTLKPSIITVENVSLGEFSISSDNASAQEIIEKYILETTGNKLSENGDKYKIQIKKSDNASANPEKYNITYNGGVFTVTYGDSQSAELAAEAFCNEIIGPGNKNYKLGNNTLNVTANTAQTSGQWNVLTSFAIMTDTHIGRYENGSSYYTDESGKTLYSTSADIQAAWKADPEGYLTGSHKGIIKSLQAITLLAQQGKIDFLVNCGDIIEAGYNYTADESNRCWQAYQYVLNQSGVNNAFYSVASGAKAESGKLPYYEIVGNHDPSFSLVVDNSYAFLTNCLWYTENANGDKIANVSFSCNYNQGQGYITDSNLKILETNLRAAANSGATQILVYNHYPVYHATAGLTDETKESVEKLCSEYGAYLYMSGHVHNADWAVTTNGTLNNVDIGWGVGYGSQVLGGTYAIVTVTDKRAIYNIYKMDESDIETRTPVKTVTVNLTTHEVTADSNGIEVTEYEDISQYRTNGKTAPTKENYVFAGWYTDCDCSVALSENVTSGKAYAKFIDADVLNVAWQIKSGTNLSSTSTDIRFISTVDCLDYSKVTFIIEKDGKQAKVDSKTVYNNIYGAGMLYNPNTFSNQSMYFMTLALSGLLQSDFEKDIKVTACLTTLDGTVVSGETAVINISSVLS